MTYHKDPEVNGAIIKLLDALCMWERDTGRSYTLILIPHRFDEKILCALNGKPLPDRLSSKEIIDYALRGRLER